LARALVTGGSGFLGAHVADALAETGFEVRTLDVVPPPPEAEHDFRQADVRDPDAVRSAAQSCDVVIDNAALVPISRVAAERYRQVNVGGCRNVLDAAEAQGAYVVHVSSTSIYGVPKRLPVTRDTPLRPFEDYGRSKAEAERLVEARRSDRFPVASLRTRALLGAGRLGVFDVIFARVRAGKLVPVLGADRPVQMCHVADFCDAVLAAIERRSNGTFNICAERIGESLREDVEELIARVGSRARVVPVPAWVGRVVLPPLAAVRVVPLTPWHWRGATAGFVADLEDAKRELGWEPARSNVEALLDAYEASVRSWNAPDAGAPHRMPLGGPLARALRRGARR
jgi:nucleoside-diphosphate-sugar epimerase